MRSNLLLLGLVAVLSMVAAPVEAQSLSAGVRVGASVDPDQFYFGGHVETAPLVDRLHFRPNVEIGIGDGATVVALNFEFAYKFPTSRSWGVYGFGGPALNIVNVGDNTESAGGFTIGIGAEHPDGLFGEFKVGTIDSPEFKIGVGYRFR